MYRDGRILSGKKRWRFCTEQSSSCLPCGAARRKALTQGNAVSGARCGPEDMATTDAVFSAARCSGVGTATRKGGEMTRIGARQQGRGAGGVGPRPLVLGARPGSSGRKANCRRGDQGDLLASGLCSAPDGGAGFMGEGATLCKQGRGDVVMARAGRASRLKSSPFIGDSGPYPGVQD